MKKKPTPKKQPSRKTPTPKVKLIDGKLSHKFLTRLEPAQGAQLEDLKKHFNEKTLNGTIISVLGNYKRLHEENQRNRDTIDEIRMHLHRNTRLIENFKDAFEDMMQPVPVKKTIDGDRPDKPRWQMAIDDICPDCGEPLVDCECEP